MRQINKLFRNALFTGMILFAFTACSNDDDPASKVFNEEYKLVKIKWAKMADDEITCKTFEDTQKAIAEKCMEGYTASIKDLEYYTQSSQFFSDDPELFSHLAGVIPDTLSIPNEYFLPASTLSSIKSASGAPLSLKMYNFPPDSYTVNGTITQERCILQVVSRIEEYQVSATYYAYFKGVSSGNEIEITGKWKGTYYRCKDHKINTLPYEE